VSVARRRELGAWRSRTTFVLALSAAAVGMGNIWRFSYLAGENGGGPYVLTYILCLFLVAVPVLIAEVVLGTHGRGAPPVAIRWAADRSMLSRGWMLLGLLACVTGLLILAYYVVVAGWAVAYAWQMQSGVFASISAAVAAGQFQFLLQDPQQLVYWQTLFLLVASLIVALGLRFGLGILVWLVVPGLIASLLVLARFALDSGDVVAAREFLFSVKLIDFTPQSVLVALGQAFYTLGVGVGTGISYGAYAPARIPVGRSVIAVALFDTVIALLAGLAIFPLVFAHNMEPAMGLGLVFISMPYAFGNSTQGEIFGMLFFVMVVLAALGSVVAMMEPIVGALMQRLRIRRMTAVLLLAVVVWLLALLVALSFVPEGYVSKLSGGSLFSLLDAVTVRLLLPLVALLTALLVGWRLRPQILRLELYRESNLFFSLWRLLLRYIAIPAIGLILVVAAVG
jgi:neurotransmitter:Na+ symporter, NSS family